MFRVSIYHDGELIEVCRYYTCQYAVGSFRVAKETAGLLKRLGVIKTYRIGLTMEVDKC